MFEMYLVLCVGTDVDCFSLFSVEFRKINDPADTKPILAALGSGQPMIIPKDDTDLEIRYSFSIYFQVRAVTFHVLLQRKQFIKFCLQMN